MGITTDNHWMRQALDLAEVAFSAQEVPVGAVIVQAGQCIGQGYNQVRRLHDPCAHAEIIAIRAAWQLQNERLPACTLYVTLEPCVMCMGALLQARVKRVVWGARDLEEGAAGSRWNVTANAPGTLQLDEGFLQAESAALLKRFFNQLRKNID